MARGKILEGPGCGDKIEIVSEGNDDGRIWITCGDVKRALTDPLSRLSAIYIYLAECPDDKPLTRTQMKKIERLYPKLRIKP